MWLRPMHTSWQQGLARRTSSPPCSCASAVIRVLSLMNTSPWAACAWLFLTLSSTCVHRWAWIISCSSTFLMNALF